MFYLPQVQDVMNNNAAGITLVAILALATVLAGIHAAAWQICVVGVILAIAVPIIAWIHQSALMTTVGLIGVIFVAFVGASLWSFVGASLWYGGRHIRSSAKRRR
jgi:uncharacterized membrane protein